MTIAGLDPGGGAGLLADIKTFEAHRLHGLGVCSALTIQNEKEIASVDWLSTKQIIRQIEQIDKCYTYTAVKIGIVEKPATLINILDYFDHRNIFIIWDPVLQSSSGFTFIQQIDAGELKNICSRISLLTPNLPEADILAYYAGQTNSIEWIKATTAIGCSILLKGGHTNSTAVNDILYTKDHTSIINGTRYAGHSKHGTGCVLSASIAANITMGHTTEQACRNAKKYIHRFMLSTETLYGLHEKPDSHD